MLTNLQSLIQFSSSTCTLYAHQSSFYHGSSLIYRVTSQWVLRSDTYLSFLHTVKQSVDLDFKILSISKTNSVPGIYIVTIPPPSEHWWIYPCWSCTQMPAYSTQWVCRPQPDCAVDYVHPLWYRAGAGASHPGTDHHCSCLMCSNSHLVRPDNQVHLHSSPARRNENQQVQNHSNVGTVSGKELSALCDFFLLFWCIIIRSNAVLFFFLLCLMYLYSRLTLHVVSLNCNKRTEL